MHDCFLHVGLDSDLKFDPRFENSFMIFGAFAWIIDCVLIEGRQAFSNQVIRHFIHTWLAI